MHVLITAGPTREPIDPVRFISNRSTGKMGFALAQAAVAAGHAVTLIAGPVALETPAGVQRIDIETACEMLATVQQQWPTADALIACAAVADWRPAQCASKKLKKVEMDGTLQLVRNPDILKTMSQDKGTRRLIGFAAETGEPSVEACRKMREKRLDMIVANDVTLPGAGFAGDTNIATFLFPDGHVEPQALCSKRVLADRIIERLAQL